MGIFDFFKKNKKNGVYKTYFGNGKLEATVNFVDDLRQGKYKYYYESGELKSTVNFVDGIKQ